MTKQKGTVANRKKITATIKRYELSGPYDYNQHKAEIRFDRNIMPNRSVTVFSEHYQDKSYNMQIFTNFIRIDSELTEKICEVDGVRWLYIRARELSITKHEDRSWGTMLEDIARKVAEYLNADIEFNPALLQPAKPFGK